MNGLWTALSLDPAIHRCVTFVGGGGKTSTMYALAQACRLAGKTVVITTTTHIMPHPQKDLILPRCSDRNILCALFGWMLAPPHSYTFHGKWRGSGFGRLS